MVGIGRNIRRCRGMAKKSQQDLADYLVVDRNTIANWENESTDVKGSYLPKIAEFFEIPISELFEQSKQKINISLKEKNKPYSLNINFLIFTDKNSLEELINLVKEKLDNEK